MRHDDRNIKRKSSIGLSDLAYQTFWTCLLSYCRVILNPGGPTTEAQYCETGKITNWALRTSKPSAITEFS